jgi:carbonic anhydrase
MPQLTELLHRNREFAAAVDPARLAMPSREQLPERILVVLTCLDPRVEPAGFLGLRTGEAGVLRNAGGRVDDRVAEDIAYLAARFGLRIDVAVIHHTQCGTGFLADPAFRRQAAEATGVPEAALEATAVTDPYVTVKADVERLLASPLLSPKVSVSGHVYDIDTGRVTTVLDAQSPSAPPGS